MYNMEVTGNFFIIKWEEFPVLIDLIGLITSADFEKKWNNNYNSFYYKLSMNLELNVMIESK